MISDNQHTHLIARYLAGQTTAKEEETLLNWIAESQEHQHLFDDYKIIWSQKLPQDQFNVAKGLAKLNYRIDEAEKVEKKTSIAWLRIAASIVFIMAAGFAIFYFAHNPASADVLVERTTQSAQKLTFQLPDGTTVKLNSNTSLRFPEKFSGDTRDVFLSGEAFFEVVKDASHPFMVRTDEDVIVQVLGTSFNIRTTETSTSIVVATGQVSVVKDSLHKLLLPHEKATYLKTTNEIITESANLGYELAWKDNTLMFNDTHLDEVARMLENWYGVTISFNDVGLKNCVITGKFVNEPISKILEAIRFSTDIEIKEKGKEIELSGTGCK